MAGIEERVADNTFVERMSDLSSRTRASLVFLCNNSTNLQEVIDQLFSHGLLTRHESQVIENEKSDYARFRQLFTLLIPRLGHGDNAQHFVNAFQQTGNEHILKELKNTVVTKGFTQTSVDTTSQSVRFNVREPVASFAGRKNFLVDLHQQILQSQQTAADVSTIFSRICVVTGLGGIGKTETVRKYIHSYGSCYQHVVWIDAEEKNTAENQFRKLALQKLQLPSKDIENNAKHFDVILEGIYDRLCTSNTLVVLDNAETLHDSDPQRHGVRSLLPKSLPSTHLKPIIIITSRLLDWPDLHSMPLPLLTPQEATAFILGKLNLEESDANAKDAETLSETFGRLPLALQVVAAVIRQESADNELMGKDVYTIQHLLRDYNKGRREVLENRPPGSPDATPLMLLWKVSLDKIRQQPHGHLATEILNVMAHLSPTNIPKDLLFSIFNTNEEKSLTEAVKLLVCYSIVHNSKTHFSIHRVLQDVTLAHLKTPTDENPKRRKLLLPTPPLIRITTRMKKYWPTVLKSSEIYDAVHENLVHVTKNHVLPRAQNSSETDFIDFIEFVLEEIKDTRLVEAEKCCRVLIAYFISSAPQSNSGLPSKSPSFKKVQRLRRKLARILREMGRYEEAAGICQESLSSLNSLKDQEEVLEEILATKKSVASILLFQGNYEEAIKLNFSVIDLYSKLHGPTHKFTLMTKNNLAITLRKRGRLSEAKTLHAEILEVRMKELGPLHLDTLRTKHGMARVLEEEGRYDDALEMLREVVEVEERELGPLHARTLMSNNSVASILGEQGNYEDALRIYADVIRSYEKASAASHPHCLIAKNNMALILEKQGKFDEAKEMFCQVLDMQEHLLGPSHKHTLSTKHCMAWVLGEQGKDAEALKLFEEVLELKTKHLGPAHPSTLRTSNAIGVLHLEMGNFEKAESIAIEVLAARQATLPSDHPSIKNTEELYEEARLLHTSSLSRINSLKFIRKLLSSILFSV